MATRVGGVADVMSDPGDGELVEPDNEEALAAALARVAKLRPRIAASRSSAIRQQYSAARMIKDIESIYEEVLQSRGSQRDAANLKKITSLMGTNCVRNLRHHHD